jgi:hypothetical protein
MATSSSKDKEDFGVMLIMDEFTLHASNVLVLGFISIDPNYLIPNGNLGGFYFLSCTLPIAYRFCLEMPYHK